MAVIISHVAIISKDNKMLILHRSPKEKVLPEFWDLPGGTVRLKESPEAGAIREAKEECSLEVGNLKLIDYTSKWDKLKQEKFVTLIFLCRKYKGRVKLNPNDHYEYDWVAVKNLKSKKIVDYLKKITKSISSI